MMGVCLSRKNIVGTSKSTVSNQWITQLPVSDSFLGFRAWHVGEIIFKNVVTRWTQKQHSHKHNQWGEIQRKQKDAPEVQPRVATPNAKQQAQPDVNSNVKGCNRRQQSLHRHDCIALKEKVLRSYITCLKLTTGNMCGSQS